MRVTVDGRTRCRRAVDLRDAGVTPEMVLGAVRRDGPPESTAAVTVSCPAPGPVHDHVGHVGEGCGVDLRAALAAAARSRGAVAPQDERLAAVRADLAALDDTTPVSQSERAAARQAVASASDREAALAERVATLRGRLQALRERGEDTTAVERERSEALSTYATVKSERVAAEQRLARCREDARRHRAVGRERLRLEDAAANLARDARATLAERIEPTVERALQRLPGPSDADLRATNERDPVALALAVGRVARLRAPVVLAADRFPSPTAAARYLDAPVVEV